MKIFLFCVLACVLIHTATGQSAPQPTVEFSDVSLVKLEDFGHVRLGYPTCGSDGTSFFLSVLNPSVSTQTRLISVSPAGKVTRFELTSVPGLKPRVGVRSFVVDADGVTVLAGAQASTAGPLQNSDQFLLQFDSSGNLKGVSGLKKDFTLVRIASFRGNRLLGLGLMEGSETPELRVMDKTGAALEKVQVAASILSPEELQDYLSRNPVDGMETQPISDQVKFALSSLELTSADKGVLVFKPGPAPWVMRIESTGKVSKLEIKPPMGVELRSIVNFGSELSIVAFGKNDRNAHILQFDKRDGHSIGELKIVGIASTSAICLKSGTYYGVRISKTEADLVEGHLVKTQ